MSTPPPARQRLAVGVDEAAEMLAVSRDWLEEWVLPELRTTRRGRRRLIPVAELHRWLDETAHRPLDRERRP